MYMREYPNIIAHLNLHVVNEIYHLKIFLSLVLVAILSSRAEF